MVAGEEIGWWGSGLAGWRLGSGGSGGWVWGGVGVWMGGGGAGVRGVGRDGPAPLCTEVGGRVTATLGRMLRHAVAYQAAWSERGVVPRVVAGTHTEHTFAQVAEGEISAHPSYSPPRAVPTHSDAKEGSCFLCVADGGFSDKAIPPNQLELYFYRLLLGELLMACSCLRKGGRFVCKIYTTLSPATSALLYLTSRLFERASAGTLVAFWGDPKESSKVRKRAKLRRLWTNRLPTFGTDSMSSGMTSTVCGPISAKFGSEPSRVEAISGGRPTEVWPADLRPSGRRTTWPPDRPIDSPTARPVPPQLYARPAHQSDLVPPLA